MGAAAKAFFCVASIFSSISPLLLLPFRLSFSFVRVAVRAIVMSAHDRTVHGESTQRDFELQEHYARDGGSRTKELLATVGDVNTDSSLEIQDDEVSRVTKSTRQDAGDMKRMGKDQQLVRNFRLLSISSFVAIATATWEIGLFTIGQSLVDGGRPGLIYTTMWNFICFAPVWLSMAEMASMAPIAGAQYHWVSEFAPESCQRFLSYMTGYVEMLYEMSWAFVNSCRNPDGHRPSPGNLEMLWASSSWEA